MIWVDIFRVKFLQFHDKKWKERRSKTLKAFKPNKLVAAVKKNCTEDKIASHTNIRAEKRNIFLESFKQIRSIRYESYSIILTNGNYYSYCCLIFLKLYVHATEMSSAKLLQFRNILTYKFVSHCEVFTIPSIPLSCTKREETPFSIIPLRFMQLSPFLLSSSIVS